jgi:hypothetical protein
MALDGLSIPSGTSQILVELTNLVLAECLQLFGAVERDLEAFSNA